MGSLFFSLDFCLKLRCLSVCALVGTCAKEGSSSFGMGNGNWGGNGDKE